MSPGQPVMITRAHAVRRYGTHIHQGGITMKLRLLIFILSLCSFLPSVVSAADRFTDLGNGTMTDTSTGLAWLKNANCTESAGGIAKTNGYLNWYDAAAWSNGLASGACGLTDGSQAGDWRVPTINELKSLICGPGAPAWQYDGCNGNTFNPNGTYPYQWLTSQGFTTVQASGYWSSILGFVGTDTAWGVDMKDGYVAVYNIGGQEYVWPVRGDYYVRVDGTPNVYYPSLQNAFDTVANDSVVLARGMIFTETLSLNRSVAVKLFGGYNIDYTNQTGVTTINGNVTIAMGSLVVDRVVIR